MSFVDDLGTARREYVVLPKPYAAEYPWVCATLGCNWGRPASEPRPLKCGRCGSKVIRAGRHGEAVGVESVGP